MQQQIQRYAGFWRQLWAGSLDIVIAMLSFVLLFICFLVALSTLFGFDTSDNALELIAIWFKALFMLYYFFYRTCTIASVHRASYAMRALGIYVENDNGEKLSFIQACAREALTYVSLLFFGIGYLIIPFTEKKQSFHDIIMQCVVCKKR